MDMKQHGAVVFEILIALPARFDAKAFLKSLVGLIKNGK